MKGYKFYIEFDSNAQKRRATKKSLFPNAGTVGAIFGRPYVSTNGLKVDGIFSVQSLPNSGVCTQSVNVEYLQEKFKRVTVWEAVAIHPNLFRTAYFCDTAEEKFFNRLAFALTAFSDRMPGDDERKARARLEMAMFCREWKKYLSVDTDFQKFADIFLLYKDPRFVGEDMAQFFGLPKVEKKYVGEIPTPVVLAACVNIELWELWVRIRNNILL